MDPPATGSDSRSDIDVFVVADTEEESQEAFERVYNHLSDADRRHNLPEIDNEMLIVRSPFAVTFCVGEPQRHIQVILLRHRCIADVIYNFDIDCCQLAWDGTTVLATPSANRALRTGINMADPARRGSNDYEWRLCKYAQRGFLVGVPGLVLENVKEDYIRNCCYCYHKGHLRKLHLKFTNGEIMPEFRVDDHPVLGLAKLLVFSTLYSPLREWNDRDEMQGYVPRIIQQGEQQFPGNIVGSLGCGNYLVHYNDLVKYVKYPGEGEGRPHKWKLTTPPYRPPLRVLTSIENAQTVDTVGMELLPWDKTPREVHSILRGRLQTGPNGEPGVPLDDTKQKMLICYDFFVDVTNQPMRQACTNILDAKNQYPNYPFTDSKGRLKRYLVFPPSADKNADPWMVLDLKKWTTGVYE